MSKKLSGYTDIMVFNENVEAYTELSYGIVDKMMKKKNSNALKPVKNLDELEEGTIVIRPNTKGVYHIERVGKHQSEIIPLPELAKYTEDGKAPVGFRAHNDGRIILFAKKEKNCGIEVQYITGILDERHWCDGPYLYKHKIVVDPELKEKLGLTFDKVSKKFQEKIVKLEEEYELKTPEHRIRLEKFKKRRAELGK